MRDIYKEEELPIPEGVTVAIKARTITVEGPRGKLTKAVKHIDLDLRLIKTAKQTLVRLIVFHGGRKHVACLRTVRSLIENMVIGVTKGFSYKMRAVYAHFPINIIISDQANSVEIRNFLGEKLVRNVKMYEGVKVSESKAQKDEIIIEGNDIEAVGQSAASIHGACLVKNKDIRKFLDGIYVSERTNVITE
ncbi:ribosomal protein L6 [Atractiella rhizophila]|nr:ribosomal protein L6 [Atractiella rhizophila]